MNWTRIMLNTLRILILAFLIVATTSQCALSDDVVLDERNNEDIFLGDFSFSHGSYIPNNKFEIQLGRDTVTAGELWTYFKSRGIHSMKSLTLCLDIDPAKSNDDLGLTGLELSIENSSANDRKTYSLGDNSLLLPGYEVSAFRSEAKMQIDLGFDFMEVYGKDSRELVTLNVKMKGEWNAKPDFFISPGDNESSWSKWSVMLWLFAIFWILVFIILFRATKPKLPSPKTPEPKKESPDKPVEALNGSKALSESFVNENRSGYRNIKTVS